jgi:hypothetical protein
MICQHCHKEVTVQEAKVEWLASRYQVSMCSTIRLVHPGCMYIHTKPKTLKALDLWDHWLPFQDLEEYLEIPKEMKWDNLLLAISFFTDYIKSNQNTTGVQP